MWAGSIGTLCKFGPLTSSKRASRPGCKSRVGAANGHASAAEKLFRENVSSVAPRQQLEAAIEFAREGDTLVVTKIDRLARSVRHLCEIVDRLQAKGVALRILNINLDTNDATGKLMLQIIGSIAEFERNIMLSRQLEGIAKAKAEGKYRGGIPTARAKAKVFALVDAGKTRGEAAEELGISIRSVFRILRTRKDAEKAPVAPPVTRISDTSASQRMIEAAVNLLPERQWLPGPPLERAGRPPSFTGTNDREIPKAIHGRCAGRLGMIPCARRYRSDLRRLL